MATWVGGASNALPSMDRHPGSSSFSQDSGRGRGYHGGTGRANHYGGRGRAGGQHGHGRWGGPPSQGYGGGRGAEGGEHGANGASRRRLDWSQPKGTYGAVSPQATTLISAYVNRLGPLVQAELDEEQRIVEERLRLWPLQRLASEGLVLTGMVAGNKRGSLFSKVVLPLMAQQGGELPFHRFSSGDLVTLCQSNPLAERSIEAVVFSRGRYELQLAVDAGLVPRIKGGVWRIDRGVNLTSYERAAAALRSLYKGVALSPASQPASLVGPGNVDEGDRDGGSTLGGPSFKRRKQHGRGGGGREEEEEDDDLPPGPHSGVGQALIAPSGVQAAAASQAPSGLMPASALAWARTIAPPALAVDISGLGSSHSRASGRSSGGGLGPSLYAGGQSQGVGGAPGTAGSGPSGLNESQAAAVAQALQHRVTLLQGPPGTGKTTTIVRLLHMLRRNFNFSSTILACAQSNVAVDNLLEGLVDLGVNAVRVGQPVRVREGLRDATLDARLLAHPLQQQLGQLLGELGDLRRRLPSLRGRDRGLGHRDVSIMRRQAKELQEQVARDVLQGAEVVCATCVGAGGDQLQGMQFGLVVLDEGSQCSEPEALIPLCRGAAHVILVGDHCQLPPVVRSVTAQQGGLGDSLFGRLIAGGAPSAMLRIQYRMHPSLSAFPSAEFYGGRLMDGVSAADRPLPGDWLRKSGSGSAGGTVFRFPAPQHPVVFIDIMSGREDVARDGSKSNEAEARRVVQLLRHMLGPLGLLPGSIGVVTPYIAQVRLLCSLLQGVVQTSRIDADTEAPGSSEVEVKSVDGYQGREKEVIVFSAVRANAQGSVGFLDDWRRMNVAITRAKRSLVLFGNAATLQADPHWRNYLSWLRDKGCIMAEQDMLA